MFTASSVYNSLIITHITTEATDVKTFALRCADGSPLVYQDGQFITLAHTLVGGKEERRSYSFSSCAALNEPPAITIKRVDNGIFSRYMHDTVQPGQQLQFTGIGGFFVLPPHPAQYTHYVFFAAGVGITPILPLIKALLYQHQHIHVVLIYSNSHPGDVVFFDALLHLLQLFGHRFSVEFLYSNAFNLARARLSKSLVGVLLREYGITEPAHSLFYVCGPFGYMRMVSYALQEAGVPLAHIRKENFNTTHRIDTLPQPPDTRTYTATISYKQRTYQIPVAYPDSILQAARRQGIPLPYSCEVGRCGSCAAICTEGKVWHSYNEVLMDVELQKGCVLTCTAHPVGGGVAISI